MLKISATKWSFAYLYFFFFSLIFKNFFIVYFSIVDEQYYISFRCAAKKFSYTNTCVYSFSSSFLATPSALVITSPDLHFKAFLKTHQNMSTAGAAPD